MRKIKPKVLLLSPLGTKGTGGIAKWTQRLLDYYKSSVCESVDLIQYYPNSEGVISDTPFLKRILIGIRCYSIMLYKLRHLLKNNSVDVVHLCSSASMGLIRDYLIIQMARKYKSKIILHFRFGRIPSLFEKKNWEYRLIRNVIYKADHVIVIDESSYRTLVNAGFSNVSKLANPLFPHVASIIDDNKLIKRVANKIVFAGHVVRNKGIMELVVACKNISNIKLCIYGRITDDMRTLILHEAGPDCNEWLEIMGERNGDETIKAMLSAGVFVLPTYTEGFPNVIIESMACGCPIVTTPVGEIPEMLDIHGDNNCGICVPVKDVNKLQHAIEKMLNNPQYAQECGQNAKNRIRTFYSIDFVWDKLLQLWDTV